MKNPRLAYKLNLMMQEEIQERRELITCLLDYYSKKDAKFNPFNQILLFSDLSTNELSQLLGDIIDSRYGQLLANINLN